MEHQYNKLSMDISTILREGTNDLIAGSIMDLLEYFRMANGDEITGEASGRIVMFHKILGPRSFYAGLWSTQWHYLHDQHLSSTRSHCSAIVWLSKLIHNVQRIPYFMRRMRNQILHQNNENFTLKEQDF